MTMDRGVGPWIERRARIAPNQAALIHGEWRCSYSELANRIRRLAHGFVVVTAPCYMLLVSLAMGIADLLGLRDPAEEACSAPSDRGCRRSSPSSQWPSNPGNRLFEIGDQPAVRGRQVANGHAGDWDLSHWEQAIPTATGSSPPAGSGSSEAIRKQAAPMAAARRSTSDSSLAGPLGLHRMLGAEHKSQASKSGHVQSGMF
jgi:hypothetical protein